jgi:hypothetical protein
VVDIVTALVFTGKVALVAPARTVTLPLVGTEATAGLLLERETTAPPLGAGPFRDTVPVEGFPPVTLPGLKVSEEGIGGITVSEAAWVPLPEAEIVTGVEAVTAVVVTRKVALVAPAGTVTLGGTVATAVLLLESETCSPAPGAGPFSVTVPVGEEVPPVALAGFMVRETRVRVSVVKLTSTQ